MLKLISRKAALSGSVCAMVLIGAISAQSEPASLPDYTSVIDFNIDFSERFDAINDNFAGVEGALGAVNTDLTQTAVSQVNAAAARITADYLIPDEGASIGTGLFLDLEQDSGTSRSSMEITNFNRAEAYTTQLDALIGAQQIGVASFNTATVDVLAGDAGESALIGLTQILDGSNATTSGEFDDAYDFSLGSINMLDAAAAYAGTARINGERFPMIDNPAYIADVDARSDDYDVATPAQIEDVNAAMINSLQQAAASLNTLAITSEVDVLLELNGQGFDVYGFSGREDGNYVGEDYVTDYDQEFGVFVGNAALAFSPRPATAEFVAPGLVSAQNDPSVSNLDQVALINMNTMSFGTAATDDTAAGTENYTILVDTAFTGDRSDSGFDGDAQYAGFNDNGNTTGEGFDEVALANVALATTIPDAYFANGGELYSDFIDVREAGLGDVALDDVSQVASLTVNSIRQNGEGALTLKAGYNDYSEEVFYTDTFVQSVEDLAMGSTPTDAGAVNYAAAVTAFGDADVTDLSQIAQFGFNAISSGGDINGWNDTSDVNGFIEQTDDGNQAYLDLRMNYATAEVFAEGNVTVDGLSQIGQLSFNTLSAGGDLNAALYQDTDIEIDQDYEVNYAFLAAGDEGGRGNVTASDLSQTAAVRLNSVAVAGEVTSVSLGQDASYLELIQFDDTMNDIAVRAYDGNASLDGADQVALLSVNTLSAGSIATDGTDTGFGIYQYANDLGSEGDWVDDEINEIDVVSNNRGDASLSDASQTVVLNLNTIASTGALSGDVYQGLYDIDLEPDVNMNDARVYASQDLSDLRNLGGNASINGLTQTLQASLNTISAASLNDALIIQDAEFVNSKLENYAFADAEFGVASANGIVQNAINRVNYMSIAAMPKID